MASIPLFSSYSITNGLHPTSDGLHPSRDGLHPTCNGLHPTYLRWPPTYLRWPPPSSVLPTSREKETCQTGFCRPNGDQKDAKRLDILRPASHRWIPPQRRESRERAVHNWPSCSLHMLPVHPRKPPSGYCVAEIVRVEQQQGRSQLRCLQRTRRPTEAHIKGKDRS